MKPDTARNCYGCKHLDKYRNECNGYCSMVERSEQGKAHRAWLREHREEFELGRKETPSIKIRRPDMERCELYEAGDFATRYKTRWDVDE